MSTLSESKTKAVLFDHQAYGDEPNIKCPNCGEMYTHIIQAGTLLGQDEYEAVIYPGTEQVGTTPERRSAVAITFECENCPGGFALVAQQAKGVNQLTVRAWAKGRT